MNYAEFPVAWGRSIGAATTSVAATMTITILIQVKDADLLSGKQAKPFYYSK
jgi:hypothetical protein